MNESSVSIIVPVHNGAAFIHDALESVLDQTHQASEIIVIDDGSTDATPRIVREYGKAVGYYWQANSGAPAARNVGIEKASAKWISFLDADDIYDKRKLEIQLSRFEKHPWVEVVMGSREHHGLCSRDDEPPEFERLEIEDHVPLQLGCGLYRRTIFERVGLFDTGLRYCDDYDWFNRAREQSVPLLLHDDVVLYQRVHAGNMTRKRQTANRFQLMAFKKSLDRRRLDPSIPGELPRLSTFHESHLEECDGEFHE